MTADLSVAIAAFNRRKAKLIQDHGSNAWVVFVGEDMRGVFGSFSAAAQYGIDHHRDVPFLVRQTDEPPLYIPLLAVSE